MVVTIATPSRFAALSNSDENGEEMDKEEIEKGEDSRNEEVDDLHQRMVEESIEEKAKETRKGRTRQTLPRQLETNHHVLPERGSNKNIMAGFFLEYAGVQQEN